MDCWIELVLASEKGSGDGITSGVIIKLGYFYVLFLFFVFLRNNKNILNNPILIHHYTSHSTLEAILKSKRIRFSTLVKVNDENEGETQDIGNVGKYIFVSCWTNNPCENNWMWEEYGDYYKGVKISFGFPPFKVFESEGTSSIIPLEGIMNEDYFVLPSRKNYFDFIEYTSVEQDLIPKTVYDYCGLGQFEFGKVGKCKEPGEWGVEEELRFIIYTLDNITIKNLD